MKLLFYGQLRDVIGTHELDYSIPTNVVDSESLRLALGQKYPSLLDPKIRMAMDDVLISGPTAIVGAREIAFLPPVSGG